MPRYKKCTYCHDDIGTPFSLTEFINTENERLKYRGEKIGSEKDVLKFCPYCGRRLLDAKEQEKKLEKKEAKAKKSEYYKVEERVALDAKLANNEAVLELANAVVFQAVKDYVNIEFKNQRYSIERFFRSRYFTTLSRNSIDVDKLMKTLNEKIEKSERGTDSTYRFRRAGLTYEQKS